MLALSACGEKTISKDTVEKQIKQKFDTDPKEKVTDVTCKDDLSAKVGKTQTCTISTSLGKKYTTTAKVTKVDGDTGYFSLTLPKEIS